MTVARYHARAKRRIADAHRRGVIDSYPAASFLNVTIDQIERLAEMAALSESV